MLGFLSRVQYILLKVNMRLFEVEFYNPNQLTRIMFAKNRQEIRKKFPGNVYKIHRIVIT